MRFGVIYKLTNKITGKSYVGLTRKTVHIRFEGHVRKSIYENKTSYICQAIRKYGRDAFEIQELCSASSKKDLCYLESYMIKKHGTFYPNGYNLTTGGECPSFSEMHLKHMSEVRLGKKRGNYSKEHRKAISDALKGRKLSPEHAEKGRKQLSCWIKENGHPMLGRTQRKESIEQMRQKKIKYRNIRVLDLENNLIGTYSDVRTCAKILKLDPARVRDCLAGNRKTHKGYKYFLDNNV